MTLSIITVTKDDFEGFKKTVNSTYRIRQGDEVKQLIIDSSLPEISEKVKRYIDGEKNLKYFWQEPSGISSAFNLGLKNIESDWVWFLNGGDIINPDLDIESFLKLLSINNSDAIIFQLVYSQSNDTFRHPQMWALWPPVLAWIPHPSTVIQRKLFNEYGLFDEKLEIAMDFEFWLRCFINNVVVDLVSLPIAEFDETGASNKLNIKTRAETKKVIRKYLWRIIKKWFRNALIIIKSLVN